MAEWTARHWSAVGACWLQCPNCLAVTRFDHVELVQLYDPKGTKDNPHPRPNAKCPQCDFRPYLPLELKHATSLDVVIAQEDSVIWATVEEATTRVVAETYGAPKELGKWRNLKQD